MSREIKFRGKSLNTGDWVYGSLLQTDGKVFICPYVKNGFGFVEVSKESVGQFTGLKDKNGVEIWERDIVTNGGGKSKVVIYQSPSFVMKEKIKNGFSKSWSEFIMAPWQNQFQEVIGNTIDNPELLGIGDRGVKSL